MGRKVKPVKLTARAIKDLEKVKDFCILNFGEHKASEIINGIMNHLAILENPDHDFIKIGAIDEDFSHLQHDYRKLLKHYCKITYREGKSNIFVIRIFDTRQDPNNNK